MTPPTREQVVQWAESLPGKLRCSDDKYGMLVGESGLQAVCVLARADLEATIAEQVAELESLRKAASWNPIATVPDDSTRVLVFSPKFGVWETCGRLAMQPRGDSGWVPIAWKLSAQNSSEIYSAIAAAPKQEK